MTDDDLQLREAPLEMFGSDSTGVPARAWCRDGKLFYELRPIPGTGRLTAEQAPRGMLDSFLRIRDEPGVLRFAQRHGVLGICEHSLPNPHHDADGKLCWPQEHQGGIYWEPTHRWRELADQARTLLEIAAKLYAKEGAEAKLWVRAVRGVGAEEMAEVATRQGPEDQRVWLAQEVNRWLTRGSPALRLFWSAAKTEPTIEIVASTFGMLALQLATAVARYRVVAFCDICGEHYYPDKYRPRVGQRKICGKKECTRKADALRKREERERRRKHA